MKLIRILAVLAILLACGCQAQPSSDQGTTPSATAAEPTLTPTHAPTVIAPSLEPTKTLTPTATPDPSPAWWTYFRAPQENIVALEPSHLPDPLPAGLSIDIYPMRQRPIAEDLTFPQIIRALEGQSRFYRFPQGKFFWETRTLAQIDESNKLLAPFGYRFTFQDTEDGGYTISLFQNDKQVVNDVTGIGRISFNRSKTDFMMLIQASFPGSGYVVVHQNTLEDWNHLYGGINNSQPQYLGDERMFTEAAIAVLPTPTSQQTPQPIPYEVVKVFLDDRMIYQTQTPARAGVSGYIGFWTYGNHWVLEVIDNIIVDGQPVNERYGYDRSYEFHLLNDRPVFFYEKAGKMGLSFDGVETPLPWQSILHYGCCSASTTNPQQFGNVLLFLAQSGERWDYVELAVEPAEVAQAIY